MQVKLVNILTYVLISSYKNDTITRNSIRHAVQYKRPLADKQLLAVDQKIIPTNLSHENRGFIWSTYINNHGN